MSKLPWTEGDIAYFIDDLGRLWTRKIDLKNFTYSPWKLVEEQQEETKG